MESLSKSDKIWLKLMELGHYTGCHQMASRSFFIKGYQFPVCARCTGVMIGQICGFILGIARVIIPLPASLLLLLIMGIDWGIQKIGIKESNNIRRFITGICGGIGTMNLYCKVIVLIIKRGNR